MNAGAVEVLSFRKSAYKSMAYGAPERTRTHGLEGRITKL